MGPSYEEGSADMAFLGVPGTKQAQQKVDCAPARFSSPALLCPDSWLGDASRGPSVPDGCLEASPKRFHGGRALGAFLGGEVPRGVEYHKVAHCLGKTCSLAAKC